MKAKLQKLIGTAGLGLALVSNSVPAWAGYVSDSQEVVVGAASASGGMAGVRYSTDGLQHIGCSFSNTNGPFVICSATDETGKSLSCVGTQPRFAVAARAITDFSRIHFSVTPGGIYCAALDVDNFSYHLR
jgi:hypothetical protein